MEQTPLNFKRKSKLFPYVTFPSQKITFIKFICSRNFGILLMEKKSNWLKSDYLYDKTVDFKEKYQS